MHLFGILEIVRYENAINSNLRIKVHFDDKYQI